MFWTTRLFSKCDGYMLVRQEVNSRLLWLAVELSVFRLVVFKEATTT